MMLDEVVFCVNVLELRVKGLFFCNLSASCIVHEDYQYVIPKAEATYQMSLE